MVADPARGIVLVHRGGGRHVPPVPPPLGDVILSFDCPGCGRARRACAQRWEPVSCVRCEAHPLRDGPWSDRTMNITVRGMPSAAMRTLL